MSFPVLYTDSFGKVRGKNAAAYKYFRGIRMGSSILTHIAESIPIPGRDANFCVIPEGTTYKNAEVVYDGETQMTFYLFPAILQSSDYEAIRSMLLSSNGFDAYLSYLTREFSSAGGSSSVNERLFGEITRLLKSSSDESLFFGNTGADACFIANMLAKKLSKPLSISGCTVSLDTKDFDRNTPVTERRLLFQSEFSFFFCMFTYCMFRVSENGKIYISLSGDKVFYKTKCKPLKESSTLLGFLENNVPECALDFRISALIGCSPYCSEVMFSDGIICICQEIHKLSKSSMLDLKSDVVASSASETKEISIFVDIFSKYIKRLAPGTETPDTKKRS